jgi:hypothetical protein
LKFISPEKNWFNFLSDKFTDVRMAISDQKISLTEYFELKIASTAPYYQRNFVERAQFKI